MPAMGCIWVNNHIRLMFVLTGLLLMAGSWASAPAQVPASAFTVDTYAGSDPLRDDGPATEALLWDPRDVAVDTAGNLYIVDQGNHILRRVDPAGEITTFAGTGQTFGGEENVPATESSIYLPERIIVDAVGNVYFTNGRNRVRRVTTDGLVATIAGSGAYGFAGDGGQAVDASFRSPLGVAVDAAGNLYIADYLNHRVRRVGLDGVITTFAGTGEEGFSGDGGQATSAQLRFPRNVAVDGEGNVYIADTSNHRIRRVAPDGVITTVAGNGTYGAPIDGVATDVRFGFPYALHAAADGTLHIGGQGYVVRVDTDGMLTVLVSGYGYAGDGGSSLEAKVDTVYGLDVAADGTVYIADSGNQRVRAITPDGNINTVAGMSHLVGDGGPAEEAVLFSPAGADLDDEGSLYVAEADNHVVRKIDASGIITTFAGTGEKGDSGDDGPALSAVFGAPSDVAVGPQGDVFVADRSAYRVRRISRDGTISTYAGTGSYGYDGDGGPAIDAKMRAPDGIAVDQEGNVYIADSGSHVIRKVDTTGIISTIAGTGESGFTGDDGPAVEAQLSSPSDVFIDGSNVLYIVDRNNTRIRRVGPDGIISTVVEHIGNIGSAVIEPNDGFLFVDTNADVLLGAWANESPKSFNIGSRGFAGDGGSARNASFDDLRRLNIASDGRIFVCDTGNHRVRVLTPVPVVEAGSVKNGASFESGNASAGSIVSWFGWNLAASTELGTTIPLPDSIGAATTSFEDADGVMYTIGNFFASGRQRNLYIPEGLAPGEGTLTVTNAHGRSASAKVNITSVAPGIFTFTGTGQGVVAATALRVAGDGTRTDVAVTQYDAEAKQWVPQPIDLGAEDEAVYLTIYCTGFRGRSDLTNVRVTVGGVDVPAAYAGMQGSFLGLDQLNIGPIPRSLIGAGEVDIAVTVDRIPANVVTIAIE